jgi:hypothetical protein
LGTRNTTEKQNSGTRRIVKETLPMAGKPWQGYAGSFFERVPDKVNSPRDFPN